MASNAAVPQANPAMSAEDLKRVFETAVSDIHDREAATRNLRYRTPIVQRRGTRVVATPMDAEKRALSDAAQALARLWKVSAANHMFPMRRIGIARDEAPACLASKAPPPAKAGLICWQILHDRGRALPVSCAFLWPHPDAK
jgi:hypothetical protein